MVLTRSVRDCAAMLQAIQGPMPGDPYAAPLPACPYPEEVGVDPGPLRIGITTTAPDGSTDTDPRCVAVAESAGRLLEEMGHTVEPARPEPWDDPEAAAALVGHFLAAYGVWTAGEVEHLGRLAGRDVVPGDVEAGTWAIAESGRAVTGVAYLAAIEFFHGLTRRMARFWAEPHEGGDGYDLLLTPTLAEPPPLLGQFGATDDNPLQGVFRSASLVPFVTPFNISGQPALSLPLGWSDDGLPIGVQLVAAYGREDLLVRVAAQLELAAPWADRRPPSVA
jgi:amidase